VPTTLTLDVGLDFERVLPGEARAVRVAAPPPLETASAPPRRLTLDDLVASVWEGLRTAQPVACPICDGVMEPRHGSGPAPVGGRCRSCGSVLG
jgi:hypothetical protein